MLNLETIHHIALITSDYEKSRHFYVDLPGFHVIRENYRPLRKDYTLYLKPDSCGLELFGIPGSPAPSDVVLPPPHKYRLSMSQWHNKSV